MNEHLEAAQAVVELCRRSSVPITIHSAAVQVMEQRGMERSRYNCFMVGRYVGELIERYQNAK